MSICLKRVPISGLGELNIYHDLMNFTRMGDFTWRESDCVELVWVTHRGMM